MFLNLIPKEEACKINKFRKLEIRTGSKSNPNTLRSSPAVSSGTQFSYSNYIYVEGNNKFSPKLIWTAGKMRIYLNFHLKCIVLHNKIKKTRNWVRSNIISSILRCTEVHNKAKENSPEGDQGILNSPCDILNLLYYFPRSILHKFFHIDILPR